MKEFTSENIRNFALVGHGTSGKTTLSEAMLFNAGVINRIGTVEDGNTVSDYHPSEIERQISVHATPLYLEWMDQKFNFIDTPGTSDFIGEALGPLGVVDFAVVTIHGTNGVEVGTEQMVKYISRHKIPKILVVTAMDKENVDFDHILSQCRAQFGNNVFPMQLPVNPGPGFHSLVDVLRKEMVTYAQDGSGKFTEGPTEGDWSDQVEDLHEKLIEFVAESDDSLLEKFFDQGSLSEEEMRAGLHAAFQNQSFIPLFCTAASDNIGITRLMDFLAKYGSSPIDRSTITGTELGTDKEKTISLSGSEAVIQVFKTISEAHVGELSFFRVYSGSVKTGDDLYNCTRGNSERFGQLFVLNGKNRVNVEKLNAGDLGAVVKLKDTHTGNTLTDPKFKVLLPETEYPKPNIHTAIRPKSKGDEEKISVGLATLHEEDPTFIFRVDPELKQTIVSGQGEIHLKSTIERLKRRFNVEVDQMEPKIPYRETIRGKGESKYRHKKQSGGAGQFAEVWMRIEPKGRGEGIEFTDSLHGQNVDRVFVPSVEKGVMAAVNEGILAGYRVVDLKVDFYDGKQHPVDSKDIAFQTAGKHAFRESFMAAQPCLLEPIMDIEVRVPEEYMGDIMGDISGRRGKIMGMDVEGGTQIIKAQVPQAELYNYATTIRSLTGGRGFHSEEFSHYENVPKDIEKKVIAASKEDEE